MADNDINLNPFGETTDIFAKQAIDPVTVPSKLPPIPKKKSKLMIIISIVAIVFAILFCSSSLFSYSYAQSGRCANKDAPKEVKNRCNTVGIDGHQRPTGCEQ